jgi:hypothetical protein
MKLSTKDDRQWWEHWLTIKRLWSYKKNNINSVQTNSKGNHTTSVKGYSVNLQLIYIPSSLVDNLF